MARHLVKSVRSWSAVGISLQPCVWETDKKMEQTGAEHNQMDVTQTDSKTKGNSLQR